MTQFTLFNLPIELLQKIACSLRVKDLNQLSCVSRSGYTLFNESLWKEKLTCLLMHVRKSNYEKVDEILERDASLLLLKGCARDGRRKFKKITAFQYALWNLDWQMWVIMIYHFKKNQLMHEAREQFDELESKGTKYGKYYDFTPLIDALDNFEKHCDCSWTSDVCEPYWYNTIGALRKKVPVHVAYVCQRERALEYIKVIRELNDTCQQALIKLKQVLAGECEQLNFCQNPIKHFF